MTVIHLHSNKTMDKQTLYDTVMALTQIVDGNGEEAVDVVFFKVAMRVKLTEGELAGSKESVSEMLKAIDYPYMDDKEHTYIEVGGWLGDQEMALRLFALGELLGLWRVITPKTMFGDLNDEQIKELAGKGLVFMNTMSKEKVQELAREAAGIGQ